ncbi:ribonuclease Oy-like [Aphidius gifuensis]|uniref:ribonuclease Oy-like n=1 Tax=Aphidius gifuensis TaxID=684658 RepID=UPI001CDBD83C|nr:ribonuclease Oy-like [Aphidius gifuensis]
MNFISSTDFDVLIFTQRLPQTVCYVWKENFSSNTCLLPTDEEWTIHGVWPTQYHKIAPSYCNESLVFNLTALATIEDKLKKTISVENGTTHYSFWEHEWSKHGTCSAVLPQLNTQMKYFEKGLGLLDKYNMKNILGQVNILPGNNYTVQEILKGVGTVLGKNCQVDCFSSKKQNVTYLFEIRICFDKSLNFIDCDGIFDFPTNNFAVFYQVIVVTFNLRLGVLGFLSTADESGICNYGKLDRAMPFQWVYNIIQNYNGNLKDITLFGHGAAMYQLIVD